MHPANFVKVLIGKSLVDVLLVSVLAVGFYFKAFPPHFHGWGEASGRSISGWAVNSAQPWERVNVQLFIDGNFAGSAIANLSRRDVPAAGWAKDEWHGYSFQLTGLQPGAHEARVYALHGSGAGVRYTLQLLGDPILFSVSADGAFSHVAGVGSAVDVRCVPRKILGFVYISSILTSGWQAD